MYVPRSLEDRILDASSQFPVILLTGPRQVGKTTLLQHLDQDDRRYVTLDDLAVRLLANEDPALFLQRFPPPVLIDEIQYAPPLLSAIKMEVDERQQPGLFWLTGSQHFQMMRGISESLAGRVAVINLLGFSQRESDRRPSTLEPFIPAMKPLQEREASAARFDLNTIFQRIWSGSFPALLTEKVKDRDLFFSSYVQTYLQRDIRDLAQVGSHERFYRFLKACAARTAQLLNLSDLARDVDISVPTARNWLSILEAGYQIYLLRPWHSNVTKRLVKTPKLYFLDTGLCAYLTNWTSPETLSSGSMSGSIFETHVLTELLKSYWHRLKTPHLYFYRDRDGREVDFLLVRDQTIHPLEVKLSATSRRKWARSFDPLARLDTAIGEGGVLCLSGRAIPLTAMHQAIPVGWL